MNSEALLRSGCACLSAVAWLRCGSGGQGHVTPWAGFPRAAAALRAVNARCFNSFWPPRHHGGCS
jgi:hypothetical protein